MLTRQQSCLALMFPRNVWSGVPFLFQQVLHYATKKDYLTILQTSPNARFYVWTHRHITCLLLYAYDMDQFGYKITTEYTKEFCLHAEVFAGLKFHRVSITISCCQFCCMFCPPLQYQDYIPVYTVLKEVKLTIFEISCS